MSLILVSGGLPLSEDDFKNIREALYLAAEYVEDIDDPDNYEPEDLESIAREAEAYRELSARLWRYYEKENLHE